MPLRIRAYVFLLSALAGCWCVFVLSSCTTSHACSPQTAEGNLGTAINSPADDYAPSRMNSSLLFSSSRTRNEEQRDAVPLTAPEALYEAVRRVDGSYAQADICRSLAVNFLRGSSPAYIMLNDTHALAVFSVPRSIGKKNNVDLYQSIYRKGVWSEPVAVEALNTTWWESQPSFAPDGSYLVFASDRPGGRGGIDLYISYREGDTWSPPRNLGNTINTPADDITPSIGRQGDLFFASKGYSKQGGTSRDFDLIFATVREAGGISWNTPRPLPEPFCSPADDVSPLMWGDSLVFASKRQGGCGGYDLYTLGLCGPVYLRGEVLPSKTLTRRAGILSILDSTGKFAQTTVREDGKFEVKLFPNRTYIARYVNACDPQPYEHEFTAPCDAFNTVVLSMPIQLPDIKPGFSFEDYNIPFFASGYYMPSTTEQLSALRTAFAYNLRGVNDSTTYIQNPGDEFDDVAPIVDSALHHAADFILRALQYRKEGCVTNGSKIVVFVDGYADTRSFSPNAIFAGETINDESLGMVIKRGAKMNNNLLATLRSYFTAKALQQQLERSPLYMQHSSWVVWRLSGKGADTTQSPNSLKRCVDVSIRVE